MNITRKIQLTAAAVVANGALALGLVSGSALAATCPQKCFDSGPYPGGCPNSGIQTICTAVAPPGCTFASYQCIFNEQCAPLAYGFVCYYH
jgi:hypothetical protein